MTTEDPNIAASPLDRQRGSHFCRNSGTFHPLRELRRQRHILVNSVILESLARDRAPFATGTPARIRHSIPRKALAFL